LEPNNVKTLRNTLCNGLFQR